MNRLESIQKNNNMLDILYSFEQGMELGTETTKIKLLNDLLNYNIDTSILEEVFDVKLLETKKSN